MSLGLLEMVTRPLERTVEIPDFAEEDWAKQIVGKTVAPFLAQVYSTRNQILHVRNVANREEMDRLYVELLKDLSNLERVMAKESL